MAEAKTQSKVYIGSEDDLYLVQKEDWIRFMIPYRCINQHFKDYITVEYLDCGLNGCVFLACGKDGKCDVVKTIAVMGYDDFKEFAEPELKLAEIMSKEGIGPKVKKILSCRGRYRPPVEERWVDVDLYFIVMERMNMSLNDYIKEMKRIAKSNLLRGVIDSRISLYQREIAHVKSRVLGLVSRMYDLGYVYLDAHPGNVLINLDSDNRVTDVKMIDYFQIELLTSNNRQEYPLNVVLKTAKKFLTQTR